MSASLIGHLGSSTFRLFRRCSFDVARGLLLLFGIGTKAHPADWALQQPRPVGPTEGTLGTASNRSLPAGSI
jgi:hypothetical protein